MALIDQHAGAAARHVEAAAAAGRSRRIVSGPEEALLALGEDQRLALVEDVVAGGHHIGAGAQHLAQYVLGDAEAAGGVLAVHHHEIERVLNNQRRQLLDHRVAAAASQEITQKQKPHRHRLACSWSIVSVSFSVTIQSSRTSCGSDGIVSTSCVAKAMPMSFGLTPRTASLASARS